MPAGNPIANIFVVLVGALVIAASLVVGFVAFVILGSIVAVLAAVVGLRIWWFNRKLRRGSAAQDKASTQSGDSVIEGEFHVIEVRRDTDKQP
jgi:membrane protein implicated in regulation of membrane protease activity